MVNIPCGKYLDLSVVRLSNVCATSKILQKILIYTTAMHGRKGSSLRNAISGALQSVAIASCGTRSATTSAAIHSCIRRSALPTTGTAYTTTKQAMCSGEGEPSTSSVLSTRSSEEDCATIVSIYQGILYLLGLTSSSHGLTTSRNANRSTCGTCYARVRAASSARIAMLRRSAILGVCDWPEHGVHREGI